MNRMTVLLGLIASGWAGALAAAPSTNAAANNRVLIIEPSSTVVSGAKATLIIGPLQRTGAIYAGDYQMKVSPYFFKNEKGRLAIDVSDESLAKVARGIVTEITGTATASRKNGATRHVDVTVTPACGNGVSPAKQLPSEIDRGKLKLWFMASNGKMIFEPAYHFAKKETPAMLTQTNMNSTLPRRTPVPPRESREAAAH